MAAAKSTRRRILDEVLRNCLHHGWKEACFSAAIAAAGLDRSDAKAEYPSGIIDVIAEFHRMLDGQMSEQSAEIDLDALRYSERVSRLLFLRFECMERFRMEAELSFETLALPQYAPKALKVTFATADYLWNCVGDRADDLNWYSKRVILAGVIASATIFWLQDKSDKCEETREFIDRRIADVMRFEKFKAAVKNDPRFGPLVNLAGRAFSFVKAPARTRKDFPGTFRTATQDNIADR